MRFGIIVLIKVLFILCFFTLSGVNSWAYYALRAAYDQLNNYSKSIGDDNKAIELDPKNRESYYNLSCVYSKMNKIPEAYNYLKKLLNAGYKDISSFLKNPDLKNLRADKGWQIFYNNLKK
ncbi:MAG: tetratricopeptide repeat protein [Brevinematales bacterium]|jgi:tetratricopeptide (TPR) repeat protein